MLATMTRSEVAAELLVEHRTTPSPPVTVGSVMSRPVITIDAQASLWEAWETMSGHGVRHLVVLANGRCAGVVDDRSIATAWPAGPLSGGQRCVRDLLTSRTACVLPEADLRVVAHVMTTDRVDGVPVVDEYGALIGFVTAGDVLHAVDCYGVSTGATELIGGD